MKPQIRTYILYVGRTSGDQPFRAVTPYHVPIPSITDDYHNMSPTRLQVVKRALESELTLAQQALTDVNHEIEHRLENA